MKKWAFLLLLVTTKSHAYPEMLRHHYVNCNACHFSPSGGGLLNQYGRTISYEVLSTWGGEKEAKPFYGALDNEKLNEWLQVGGDVRGLQMHHENAAIKEGRFIPMQAHLELAVTFQKWTVVSSIGKTDKDWNIQPVSSRYYALYQPLDELSIKAGRFIPNFGLNVPQHNLPTRANIGFNQGTERDGVEAMWSGEKWNSSLTASQNVRRTNSEELENSVGGQLNYTFADSYRFGGSYYNAQSESLRKDIFGLHTILGFNEKFYVLAESDFMGRTTKATQSYQRGFYHFGKAAYEFIKGLHFQFVEEYAKSNLDKDNSESTSYGVGFLFYPRPHFELETLFSKKRFLVVNADEEDYAYLMVHYYF